MLSLFAVSKMKTFQLLSVKNNDLAIGEIPICVSTVGWPRLSRAYVAFSLPGAVEKHGVEWLWDRSEEGSVRWRASDFIFLRYWSSSVKLYCGLKDALISCLWLMHKTRAQNVSRMSCSWRVSPRVFLFVIL